MVSMSLVRAACLVGMLPALAVAGTDGWLGYRGEARAPGDGELLYVEEHWMRQAGGRIAERVVLYRCPGGVPFARKRVDYAGSPVAPHFLLEDGRDGYREGLRREAAGAILLVRPGRDGREREAPVDEDGLVADAGFDEFVRREWERLLAGESLELRFAVPARQEAMRFRVRHLGRRMLDGEAVEAFRLRLGGLVGLVAPQIDVVYATDSRRLLRYQGLTNLRDGRGRQWQADIRFPEAPVPVPEEALRRAERIPLGRCG